ncbi:hypothetical protein amrb99_21350 [Actinomadura sp. RB99]|nr:hypothetical protein [Actinomadura sp. RB99]
MDIADVNTVQGDTALTPFGGGTGGSRSGSMTAGAIAETAPVLRERITAIAAHRLEASVGDIELSAGRARVRGTPGAEIASIACFQRPRACRPGAALARLEGRIALEEILKRFPTWEVGPTSGRRWVGDANQD